MLSLHFPHLVIAEQPAATLDQVEEELGRVAENAAKILRYLREHPQAAQPSFVSRVEALVTATVLHLRNGIPMYRRLFEQQAENDDPDRLLKLAENLDDVRELAAHCQDQYMVLIADMIRAGLVRPTSAD